MPEMYLRQPGVVCRPLKTRKEYKSSKKQIHDIFIKMN